MSAEEIDALSKAGNERIFAAGARVFSAGDEGDCLYFILSGEVEASISTDSGHRLRLTTMGPGMVFGEVALLNKKRRTANVEALVNAKCLEVCVDGLPEAVRTRILVNMASHFAGKIERDTALVQHLG
jgi:glutaminase